MTYAALNTLLACSCQFIPSLYYNVEPVHRVTELKSANARCTEMRRRVIGAARLMSVINCPCRSSRYVASPGGRRHRRVGDWSPSRYVKVKKKRSYPRWRLGVSLIPAAGSNALDDKVEGGSALWSVGSSTISMERQFHRCAASHVQGPNSRPVSWQCGPNSARRNSACYSQIPVSLTTAYISISPMEKSVYGRRGTQKAKRASYTRSLKRSYYPGSPQLRQRTGCQRVLTCCEAGLRLAWMKWRLVLRTSFDQ